MATPEPEKQFWKDSKVRYVWKIARPERRKIRYPFSRGITV